jgi:DNA invertase Pin-like site-specific DNA recombinase
MFMNDQTPLLKDSTMPVLAFAYGRVSKRVVGSTGLSPQELSVELQDEDLRNYARRQGIPLDRLQVFLERHSGSFTFADIRKRKAGPKLLAAIEKARQDFPSAEIHLLITKCDRLGRGWLATQNLLHELRETLKVRLHIIDMGGKTFDCDSMEGQLIVSVLLWVAEMEVRNTQKRICRALSGLRDQGYITGTVGYGWDAEPTGKTNAKGKPLRRRVDNLQEQKWILHMDALHRSGWGYHSIAKDLNERGVPTKRRGEVLLLLNGNKDPEGCVRKLTSGKWQAGNVAKVLQNKTTQAWLASREQQQQKAA